MNYSWKTRVFSMFLAVVMVFGMLPMSVFATEGEQGEATPAEAGQVNMPELANVEEEKEQEAAEVSYTVKHYLQNADGTYPEEAAETETLTGNVGEKTTAAAKAYEGYVAQSFEQADIAEDGSTVVVIRYALEVKEETKTASYTVKHCLQNEDGTYPEEAAETETKSGNVGEKTTAAAKAYEGYVAQSFEQADIAEDGSTVVEIRYAVKAEEEPKTADYTVKHYLQTAEGYELKETETLNGNVGEKTTAAAKEFEGYTAQEFQQSEIKADGSAVVEIYYNAEPESAEATIGGGIESLGMTIVSDKKSTLAPGITMNEIVLFDVNGERVEMQVTTSDTNVDTVHFYANYKNNDISLVGQNAMQTLSEQVAAMEANYEEPFKVVAGLNASYYNTTTAVPNGAFVMEGVDKSASGDSFAFFAVLKDGTVMIGDKGEYSKYKGQIKEAIGGQIHIIKDGKIVSGLEKAKYPRQTIGITADGKVITMTADGSQAPKTVGLTVQEQAEVMLALGCVEALHLDGGNSATFGAVREGTDKFVTVNSPSGNAERAVSNTLMIVSTAVPDGSFDHAVISSEYDYMVPHTSHTFSAIGVDAANGTAEIPESAVWTLSDGSFGTITADGIFTSNGKLGAVSIQLTVDSKIVGFKNIQVVTPTAISFAGTETTVPYGKSAELPVTAMYGNNEACCDADSFNWTVDPAAAGTLDGFYFAAAEESSISSAVITAAYKHAEGLENTSITVKFGKGSEVLFDFEDGDISDWRGLDTIDGWLETEIAKYPDTKHPIVKVKDYDNGVATQDSSVFLASAQNGGKVKSGNYALGVSLDRLNATGVGSWLYNYIYYTGDAQIWRDVANGKSAVRVGMWVNLPQDATNTAFRICRTFDDKGVRKSDAQYMTSDYDGKKVSYNTDYGIPESGWIYVYFDLTAYDFQSSTQYNPDVCYAENYRADKGHTISTYPAFIQFINGDKNDTMAETVIYIDDITLDYSDVTEDRDAPVISSVTVCSDGSNDVALNNGQTVTSNQLTFSAKVSDTSGNANATGLNYGSAKVYVDGVDMSHKSFSAGNGMLSLNNVNLTDGQHSVSFVIYDNQGNESRVTKTLTVNATAGNAKVWLAGHNDGKHTPKAGSVYYIDVMASDASKIANVATTLKLNTANTFEYGHIICADGVTVTSSYDSKNFELTLKINHDGTLTGEKALVSVPVRVWAWDEKATGITAAEQFASAAIPVIDIECATTLGNVVYTDGAFADYAHGFYTALDVKTELDDKTAWHAHSAAAMEDKAPDCTHSGYTGRTYCDGCKSVVAWGTTVAATGHTYDFVEGVLKCACGETFTGVYTDGKEYVDGICVADGWQGEVYYKDGKKLTGIQKVPAPDASGEFYYDFDEDGICAGKVKYNGLFQDQDGVYRYAKLGVLSSGWQMVGEDWYYFEADTMAAASGTYQYTDDIVYEFAEDGKILSGCWVKTLYGTKYYYGPAAYKVGWYNIDGKSYYFGDYYRYEGYRMTRSEGSNVLAWYNFGADGALIPGTIPDGFYDDGGNGVGYVRDGLGLLGEQVIDGVYYAFDWKGYAVTGEYGGRLYGDDYKAVTGIIEKNGELRYYENGKPKMAGLIEVDGSYYFAKGDGVIVTDQEYYVWQGNGIVPESTRTFGADGKMLNGIVEMNGGYYYYNMGMPEMAGLIEVNGDYYFAKDNKGTIVTGQTYYVWQPNGIIPESDRTFGTDGKMYNGVVKIDDGYYYYNMGKPEMAGLIEWNGNYYFARDAKGAIITNQTYYVWKSNDLMPEGNYTFDVEGKMRDGIVEIDGGLYYYENGKPKMAGLIEFEGHYYFAKGDGVIITDQTYYVWQGNGILPESNRTFGKDGKMLDGIVAENGGYRYYDKGQPKMAGLVEVDGNYYFAKGDGVIITDQTYYVWQGNGIIPESDRTFGADGKMLNGIVEIDAGYYYYNMGKPEMAGLIEIDGSYYFAKDAKGTIVTDQTYYVWKSNGLLPEGEYIFDAEGKMLDGFVTKDDGIYYYEDGKIGTVGLNYIDGYYYFVGYDGKLVTNKTYYVWKPNGLTMAMNYTFDAQGRIVL